jgi:hypothetical protein
MISVRSKKKSEKGEEVTPMQPGRQGPKKKRILVGLSLALMLGGLAVLLTPAGLPVRSAYGQADAQTTVNLVLKSIELSPNFYVEDPSTQPIITIKAFIVNDGPDDLTFGRFSVQMAFRREDQDEFSAITVCSPCSFGPFSEANPLPAGDRNGLEASGFLSVANLAAGRYIIKVTLETQGIPQTSVEDDAQEALLLIGLTLPEFHPVSITFSPPSPVPQGATVTVRVEIENTGRPANPEMEVTFEYCLENPPCEEFSSQGFENGTKRLSAEETRPLSEGKRLAATDRLDTRLLQAGRYTFRATVKVLEGRELDGANNEISTLLTIGGVTAGNPPLCRLSGEIIILGQGVGTSTKGPIQVIYMGTKDETGRVTLHVLRKNDVEDAEAGTPCPEINRLDLPAEITSFALDENVKVLYVGLANGQLVIVNVDNPETLDARFKTVAASFPVESRALQALAPHLLRRGESEVFIGARSGNLYRVRLAKDEQRQISEDSIKSALCFQSGSPISLVVIEQGNKYLGTENGTLYRMPEDACPRLDSGSDKTKILFTASSAIRALTFGRVTRTFIVVGLANGNLHVLLLGGQDVSGSPIDLNEPISSLAFDRRNQAVYAGTLTGSIHAISLGSRFVKCSLTGVIRNAVNVLSVDDGGKAGELPGSGLVFAGADDANLYVMSDTCDLVKPPQPADGPIRPTLTLKAIFDDFGFLEGISVLYGGGNGLYRLPIQLPVVP